jgi:hypothetical protein
MKTPFDRNPTFRAAAVVAGLLALATFSMTPAHAALPSTVAVATPTANGGVTYEGFTFPPTMRVADTELHLNGVGRRAPLYYRVYAAALYLPHKLTTGAAVLADTGPKRLQLRLMTSGPSEEFVKAFDGGIAKRVPPEQLAAMRDRVDAFDNVLRSYGDLHKGDVIDLDYVPGKGTFVAVNDKVNPKVVAGADLYAAMLSIFVGDRALDKGMRDGLLGGTPN